MQTDSEAQLLRIFIGESDKYNGRPVYEEFVLKARESNLAGATVIKEIIDLGAKRKFNT